MKTVRINVKENEKICAFCGLYYYPTRKNAKYCSNKCKNSAFQIRETNRQGYCGDLNTKIKLRPGTITSQGMAESCLLFSGNYEGLIGELTRSYISQKELENELQFLNELQPICKSLDWSKASCQIFTEEFLLEVLMVNLRFYKLYGQRWGSDDEKPFPI